MTSCRVADGGRQNPKLARTTSYILGVWVLCFLVSASPAIIIIPNCYLVRQSRGTHPWPWIPLVTCLVHAVLSPFRHSFLYSVLTRNPQTLSSSSQDQTHDRLCQPNIEPMTATRQHVNTSKTGTQSPHAGAASSGPSAATAVASATATIISSIVPRLGSTQSRSPTQILGRTPRRNPTSAPLSRRILKTSGSGGPQRHALRGPLLGGGSLGREGRLVCAVGLLRRAGRCFG